MIRFQGVDFLLHVFCDPLEVDTTGGRNVGSGRYRRLPARVPSNQAGRWLHTLTPWRGTPGAYSFERRGNNLLGPDGHPTFPEMRVGIPASSQEIQHLRGPQNTARHLDEPGW